MTVTRQNQTAENNLNGKNGKTNRMQISAVKTHKMDLEGEKNKGQHCQYVHKHTSRTNINLRHLESGEITRAPSQKGKK